MRLKDKSIHEAYALAGEKWQTTVLSTDSEERRETVGNQNISPTPPLTEKTVAKNTIVVQAVVHRETDTQPLTETST
ncbi:hypothetical protein Q7C36_020438 [Tachysurus vachellii]|uniref:Uncharacterized protein n=1 Tax=Tachysurus vachellii TaxID=175792 RepID=A0AA88LP57_TACVA|nr:hypothetical protein Q7C36_020438 [Tachysurus vachellii]